MSNEAQTGRRTPYELVFGAERFAEREFPAVLEEARERELGLSSPQEFALVGHVGALLEELVPEETDSAAIGHHLDILFHAFHFWREGHRIYAFDEPVVRSLLESPPVLTDWRASLPAPAFYVELPRNLFWAAAVEGQPPEPVEGMWVKRSERSARAIDLLVILGMWPDRPGFSAAHIAADLEAPHIDQPRAFESDVPGAALASIYSLQRSSDAVLLLGRLLWYLETYPGSADLVAAGAAQPSEGETELEHYRVGLVERSAG